MCSPSQISQLCSGRNSFKPISGYVNVEYLQRMDVNAVMPVKKLYYSTETNLLYAFDGDSPLVRCIRWAIRRLGTCRCYGHVCVWPRAASSVFMGSTSQLVELWDVM